MNTKLGDKVKILVGAKAGFIAIVSTIWDNDNVSVTFPGEHGQYAYSTNEIKLINAKKPVTFTVYYDDADGEQMKIQGLKRKHDAKLVAFGILCGGGYNVMVIKGGKQIDFK
jgi:hypothetical protein